MGFQAKRLKMALAALVFIFVVTSASTLWAGPFFSFGQKRVRSLSFSNTHTGEVLSEVVYWEEGNYNLVAIEQINHHLRDHRLNEATEMDESLLDLLWDLRKGLEAKHDTEIVFHVISGYRSPKTNAKLRSAGGGQAKKSRHMHGDAIDIRVPGISTIELRNTAYCLKRGGVGYYSGSDFVHVDTHKVRHWNWSPSSVRCAENMELVSR